MDEAELKKRREVMAEAATTAMKAVAGMPSDDATRALLLAAAMLARLSKANHKNWKQATESAWHKVPEFDTLLGRVREGAANRLGLFAAAMEALRAVFR